MERSKKIIQISVIGIIVNLVLVIFKTAVGLITHSVAIIMDAVNNLSDALSSVITIIGTKLAGRAPDKKHPYGYGRIEYISSITIAAIVLVAGFTSFKESFEKIVHPDNVKYTPISMIIIAVAVLVKFLLGGYVKSAGKKYNSESLIASGTDATFDSIISFSTLVAAAISIIFKVGIEGYLGVVIAVLIVKAGIEMMLDSLSSIVGARVDSELSTKLKKDISGYPDVKGTYDLILHRYGPERIIGSVHIELPDEITAKEIHNLTRRIIEDVYMNYGIILTVGIYASNTGNGLFAQMKTELEKIISQYPEVLQMHGFYVDCDRMLVSFDIIIDFKSDNKMQIRDEILESIREKYPEYQFNAVLDNDYSD